MLSIAEGSFEVLLLFQRAPHHHHQRKSFSHACTHLKSVLHMYATSACVHNLGVDEEEGIKRGHCGQHEPAE